MSHKTDIAIVGGAIMGSATAFWLSRLDPSLRITVLERDTSFAKAGTALSVASIRQQFSNALNVEISRFGIHFLKNIHDYIALPDGIDPVCLQENGYLFLAGTAAQAQQMRDNQQVQLAHGADTRLLDRQELATRYPWMALEDVALGSFGARDEGWFDNMGVLGALRDAARTAGVQMRRAEVTGIDRQGDRITTLMLADGERVDCGAVVNCAGTRGAELARQMGEDIPVEARKRTVFYIDAPNARHPDAPLLVDHTGFYMRPEGDRWICATVPEMDPVADLEDFTPNHAEFEEILWERLYARAPGFDAVKVIRSWAGQYDFNTLDHNAIVGRHLGLQNAYVANGFSGHGLQQAPAIGRGLAELIIHGAYQTLDLADLGPERVRAGRPYLERNVV